LPFSNSFLIYSTILKPFSVNGLNTKLFGDKYGFIDIAVSPKYLIIIFISASAKMVSNDPGCYQSSKSTFLKSIFSSSILYFSFIRTKLDMYLSTCI